MRQAWFIIEVDKTIRRKRSLHRKPMANGTVISREALDAIQRTNSCFIRILVGLNIFRSLRILHTLLLGDSWHDVEVTLSGISCIISLKENITRGRLLRQVVASVVGEGMVSIVFSER